MGSNRCSPPAKALLLYEVVVRIAPGVVATMRCDSRRMHILLWRTIVMGP